MPSHSSIDDVTKDLSDADVDAVVEEVLATPDLVADDAEEPKVLGPPPGLGQTEASDAAAVLPGVPSHSSIDDVTKDLSDADVDAVVEEVWPRRPRRRRPRGAQSPRSASGSGPDIDDRRRQNRDDEPFTEPSLPSAPKPEV